METTEDRPIDSPLSVMLADYAAQAETSARASMATAEAAEDDSARAEAYTRAEMDSAVAFVLTQLSQEAEGWEALEDSAAARRAVAESTLRAAHQAPAYGRTAEAQVVALCVLAAITRSA